MLRRSHNALSAKSLGGSRNSRVISSNYYLLGQPGKARPLVCVLDKKFARIFGENFTGESCRTISSRYNSYYQHFILYLYASKVVFAKQVVQQSESIRSVMLRPKTEFVNNERIFLVIIG
jgi:hypothetical protein